MDKLRRPLDALLYAPQRLQQQQRQQQRDLQLTQRRLKTSIRPEKRRGLGRSAT